MRRFLHFIRTRIANQRVTPAAKPQPATLRYNIENVTADTDFVRIRGWAWSLLQSPEELQSSQIRITVTDADGQPVPFEKQIQSRPDVADALFSRQLGIEAGFHLLFLSSGKFPYRLILQDEAMRTEETISDFEPSDCPPEPWTLGFGYHWRMHPASTAENPESKAYCYDAAKRAIEAALQRRQLQAEVAILEHPGYYRVTYIPPLTPKVSILMINQDRPDRLMACLNSIFLHLTYPNYEICILDHGSVEGETFAYDQNLGSAPVPVRILSWNKAYNASVMYNWTVPQCDDFRQTAGVQRLLYAGCHHRHHVQHEMV